MSAGRALAPSQWLDGACGRFPVVRTAGVPVVACGPAAAARAVVRLAAAPRQRGADVHLCNAYTLACADRDPDLGRVLAAATANFPDGKSVVWANRLAGRGQDLPTARVYGPDLFADVLRLGQDAGLRHHLLGSTPAVLDALAARIRDRFPAALLVGAESPPFRPLTPAERDAQAARLRTSRAHVVWVGLGTPLQDHEAARLARDVPAVFVAVGAAFDFLAGTKRQAPEWMRSNGLEWTFRLATEPRRLWRRYLFGNSRFVRAVVRDLGGWSAQDGHW